MNFIKPNWPAPPNIHAYTTTRAAGDFADLQNRPLLNKLLALPNDPIWLKQEHGTMAVKADSVPKNTVADASYTDQANTVCAVLTADCLPLLLCDRQGTGVAAIHAGWRGLAAGVIEQTLKTFACPAHEILAWLGPAIGPEVFEVGNEVKEQFIAVDTQAEIAFKPSPQGRWLADIYLLAKQRLVKYGINAIYGGKFCTYTDTQQFFSYRRDHDARRMATVIWLTL